MNLLKHRSMRFYLVFFLILTMAIGGSAIAAFADGGPASVAVNAGTLTGTGFSITQPNAVTLTDGSDQTTSYSLGFTVNDARGTGPGWSLTISSTDFTGPSSPSNITSSMTAASATCASTNCTNPSASTITYPLPVSSSTVKFFSAPVNSGMGKFTMASSVNLSIPGNILVGTYTSTVTVTLANTP